jgi:hypothetical protein
MICAGTEARSKLALSVALLDQLQMRTELDALISKRSEVFWNATSRSVCDLSTLDPAKEQLQLRGPAGEIVQRFIPALRQTALAIHALLQELDQAGSSGGGVCGTGNGALAGAAGQPGRIALNKADIRASEGLRRYIISAASSLQELVEHLEWSILQSHPVWLDTLIVRIMKAFDPATNPVHVTVAPISSSSPRGEYSQLPHFDNLLGYIEGVSAELKNGPFTKYFTQGCIDILSSAECKLSDCGALLQCVPWVTHCQIYLAGFMVHEVGHFVASRRKSTRTKGEKAESLEQLFLRMASAFYRTRFGDLQPTTKLEELRDYPLVQQMLKIEGLTSLKYEKYKQIRESIVSSAMQQMVELFADCFAVNGLGPVPYATFMDRALRLSETDSPAEMLSDWINPARDNKECPFTHAKPQDYERQIKHIYEFGPTHPPHILRIALLALKLNITDKKICKKLGLGPLYNELIFGINKRLFKCKIVDDIRLVTARLYEKGDFRYILTDFYLALFREHYWRIEKRADDCYVKQRDPAIKTSIANIEYGLLKAVFDYANRKPSRQDPKLLDELAGRLKGHHPATHILSVAFCLLRETDGANWTSYCDKRERLLRLIDKAQDDSLPGLEGQAKQKLQSGSCDDAQKVINQ